MEDKDVAARPSSSTNCSGVNKRGVNKRGKTCPWERNSFPPQLVAIPPPNSLHPVNYETHLPPLNSGSYLFEGPHHIT